MTARSVARIERLSESNLMIPEASILGFSGAPASLGAPHPSPCPIFAFAKAACALRASARWDEVR